MFESDLVTKDGTITGAFHHKTPEREVKYRRLRELAALVIPPGETVPRKLPDAEAQELKLLAEELDGKDGSPGTLQSFLHDLRFLRYLESQWPTQGDRDERERLHRAAEQAWMDYQLSQGRDEGCFSRLVEAATALRKHEQAKLPQGIVAEAVFRWNSAMFSDAP